MIALHGYFGGYPEFHPHEAGLDLLTDHVMGRMTDEQVQAALVARRRAREISAEAQLQAEGERFDGQG